MNRTKIFLIIGTIILLISVPLGILLLKQKTVFKLGAQQPLLAPENVQVTNITAQTATISWTTQKPTQSLISYGISPENLTLIQVENTPAINHYIILKNLLPNTTYFFVVKTGDKIFNNNGQPYQFTTKPQKEETFLSPTPIITPFITSSPTLLPSLDEEEIKKVMGTTSALYDLNKDGIVNALDILLFHQQKSKK